MTPPTAIQNMVRSLLADVGLPIAAYFAAELAGASAYRALLAGTVVAGARTAWLAIRERRLDAFASFLLVLFGAGWLSLSSPVTHGSSWPRTQRRLRRRGWSSWVVAWRSTAGLLRRQAIAGSAGSAEFTATADFDDMRSRWYRVSLVWGLGLLTDAALRVACIYLLSPATAANVSHALMVTAYTLLVTWTIRSAKKIKARSSAPTCRHQSA